MPEQRRHWLVATSSRRDSPGRFLAAGGRRPGKRQVVACVGDSITQGLVSANYVDLLKRDYSPAGFQFINAGRNSDLAHSVLRRIDAVVACEPDYVTLLVGTNDVNARFSLRWEWIYRLQGRLPVRPSLAWYSEGIERILVEFRARTTAQLAVLDLPMLGEDLGSPTNRRISEYNDALRTIASRMGVTCLPLHDRLTSLLSPEHDPSPYRGRIRNMIASSFEHLVLGRSWNDISRGRGLSLLTDETHLNDIAAGVVAELIGNFIASHPPAGLSDPESS